MTPADATLTEEAGTSGVALDADHLALHLLTSTQAAAMACVPWVGRGDKVAADQAAVTALRSELASVPGQGQVVIGEGEKDDAPMLYEGEELGTGSGPGWDLAVDPLEGTNYCAQGAEGAIAVLSVTARGAMWGTSGWYMDKLVVGPAAAGSIDIEAPIEENLRRVAQALEKEVGDLVTIVLDKPRHQELMAKIRAAGAKVLQIPDGDVMGSLLALVPGGGVDISLGIGGAPEGVLTATAARLLGGEMQGRLTPQSEEERALVAGDGVDIDAVLTLDDLVAGDDCAFVATAVTNSALLSAPRATPTGWRTSSLVITPRHRPLFVEALVATPASGAYDAHSVHQRPEAR
jgi:fructose-1,6-bisphosphatase II